MTAGTALALIIVVAVAIIMRCPPATPEEQDDMREDWDR